MTERVRPGPIGAIRAVTYAAPDLEAVEAAYVGALGYQVVGRSPVSADQAAAWDAPAVAGRPALVLGPASGEPVLLRFVLSPAALGWQALKTYGWNATEFVVQNVDDLARRLQDSPFRIIGPPKGLTRFPMIRAMQAIGPAGECCYFTQVGEGSGLDLAPALSAVGRVFIVVAAGPDAEALFAPYIALGLPWDAPVSTPVRVISDAHGLPHDSLHPHGLVRLTRGTLVELDGYPPSATRRPQLPGELTPGMAVVSFEAEALEPGLEGPFQFIAPPTQSDLPGAGHAACFRGAAGELIELVTGMEA
jgi:catechol 2,3-dioxygenase-like lactoylglutathione lyase family enzyme